jgi:hypothetical protein
VFLMLRVQRFLVYITSQTLSYKLDENATDRAYREGEKKRSRRRQTSEEKILTFGEKKAATCRQREKQNSQSDHR